MVLALKLLPRNSCHSSGSDPRHKPKIISDGLTAKMGQWTKIEGLVDKDGLDK